MNPTPGPRIDPTPYVYDAQDLSRCAVACFAATASFTTVPYFSLGAAHSVALAYQGDRNDLRPFVHVRVKHPGGSYNTPTQFWLQVKVDAGGGYALRTFTNGETLLHSTGSPDTVRLGGQLDVSDLNTGAYPMQIIVTSQYSGSTQATTHTTKLVVVNERNSVVARGWTLAGVQRLYVQGDSSVIVTEGEGSAIYFNRPTPGAYTTPVGEFSKLTLSSGVYTRAYPDSTKIRFDNLGRMLDVRDPFGNRDTLVYYDTGSVYRVKQIRDPLYTNSPVDTTYRRITLTWGSNGLSSISDGFGRTTTVYVHATTRLLDSIADPGGGVTRYGYDASSRLASVTDRRGNATKIAYDTHWRVSADTAPAVSIGGSLQKPVIRYSSWQKAGVPLSATSSTPATSPRADTIQATLTDPLGYVTKFTVDRWGQPLQVTNPLAQVTAILRNGNGQPIRVSPPFAQADSFAYNAGGFMTFAKTGGRQVTIVDGGWGRASQISGDVPTRVNYINNSASGRVDSVRVAGIIVARVWYDGRGRDTTMKDAAAHMHKFQYANAVGQLSRDSAPSGLMIQRSYDKYGRDSTSVVGSLPPRLSLYDILNRPTQAFDTVNAVSWKFRYDSLFLTQVENPRGYIRYTERNALGWMTSNWNSLQGTGVRDSFFYDSAGRQVQWVNRRNQAVNFAYDALGRRTRHWTTAAADTVTYTDSLRIVKVSNGLVTETNYMNVKLQVDSVRIDHWAPVSRWWKLRFHYTALNPAGLLDSLSETTNAADSLHRRGYGYNGAFALTSLRFDSALTTITRNIEQEGTSYALPTRNSLTITRTRNVLHTQTQIGASDTWVNVLAGRGYRLDSLGRVRAERSVPDTNKVRKFDYTRLGQLAQEAFYTLTGSCPIDSLLGENCATAPTPDSTHAYSYDALGNRLDHSGSYLVDDRITGFNGLTFAHDSAGNVTKKKVSSTDSTVFYWSAEGLLDSVRTKTTRYWFRYDPLGRLARRYVNGALDRVFVWSGGQLLAEYGGDSTNVALIAEYSWYPGLDMPHAVRTPGGVVRFFVQDGLGGVSGLVDTTGTKPLATLRFDPWGSTIRNTGFDADTVRPRWKGAFVEPGVGLYYLRDRWYDPQTGRFLSPDPLGLDAGGNVFTFAGADPVNARDPTGLDNVAGNSDCPDPADDWWETIPGNFLCPIYSGGYQESRKADPQHLVLTNPSDIEDFLKWYLSLDFSSVKGSPGGASGGSGNKAATKLAGAGQSFASTELSRLEKAIAGVTPDWMVPFGQCVGKYTSTPLGIGLLANTALSTAVAGKGGYALGSSVRFGSWQHRVGLSLDGGGLKGAAGAGRLLGRVAFFLTVADAAYDYAIMAQCYSGLIH